MSEQILPAVIGAAVAAALVGGLVAVMFRRLERRFDVVDGLAERTAVHEQRLTAVEGLAKETADDFYKLQLEHAGNHARARAG